METIAPEFERVGNMTYGNDADAALGLAELGNGKVFSAGGNFGFAAQLGISIAEPLTSHPAAQKNDYTHR